MPNGNQNKKPRVCWGGIVRNAALAAADALAISASWSLAVWGYWAVGLGHYKPGWTIYLDFWPVVIAFLTVNASYRLYHGNPFSPSAPVSPHEEMRRLMLSSIVVHVATVAMLAFAFQTTRGYSRAIISIAGILTTLMAQPLRDFVRRILHRLSIGRIAVAVFGDAVQVARMQRLFAYDDYLGFRPVGPQESAEVAVVCETGSRLMSLSGMLASYAHVICFPGRLLPPVGDAVTVAMNGFGGIAFDSRRQMRLPRLVKRSLDVLIAASSVGLLLPVFAFVALLVKATSRGPVFHRRKMFGLGGRPFRLWEFRTVYGDARTLSRAGAFRKRTAHLTTVGRFLRRTSLSVLPRLFNVLAGDMSLVGPSPVSVQERDRYGAAYATIASVRPGIVGLWRAVGCRSDDYGRRAVLGEYYALNWSIWMDLWILLRSAKSVFMLNDAPNLKILVVTQTSDPMPRGNARVLLQVGAAGKPPIGCFRDDEGENISAKNATYRELTGLYWAWKNLDSEALGLEHRRRLFRVSPQAIALALETHDAVLPPRQHYVIETNFSQYAHAHHAEDLALTRAILAERHPDYLAAYDAVMGRLSGHRHNMFVMRRTVLNRYCAWLFDVLSELERRLDVSAYSADDACAFSRIAEHLLDVWIERNGISYVECPVRDLERRSRLSKFGGLLWRKVRGVYRDLKCGRRRGDLRAAADGTALLHYWLTCMRGGEYVFNEICSLYPHGDVYTHVHDPNAVPVRATHDVHETTIARLPFGRLLPQAFLPLMPWVNRRIDLDGYRLIVSSESGPIKGIRKPEGAVHVCYCHTPMRYVWDLYDDYYRSASFAGRIVMRLFRDYLRRADLKSADSVDLFIANSNFVAERIRRIYGRKSVVVHPPVDFAYFSALPPAPAEGRPHYLFAGQLVCYKRADLAVRACKKLGRRLQVVGTGNQRLKLQMLAAGDPNITFVGRIGKEALRDEYVRARALLFPGLEDFGIVPLEAQAAGTPVIAYGKGGALETVVAEGEPTGVFFREQTVESLCEAILEFESRAWSPEACRAQAERFRPEVFRQAFRAAVASAVFRDF